MLFAILCTDKKDHLQTRLDNRPNHLEFLKSLGTTLKIAGPFLDENGKPNGSMLVVEAENADKATAIAAGDPYAKAGLFETVQVRAWNWTVNNPEAA